MTAQDMANKVSIDSLDEKFEEAFNDLAQIINFDRLNEMLDRINQ